MNTATLPTRLPRRAGPPPQVSDGLPQQQLDQQQLSLRVPLLERLRALPAVQFGPSRRAPLGTVGLHLPAHRCCDRADAFLIDHEFAHVHAGNDASLHLVLPEPLRSEALAAGWARPHPLAGQPAVSAGTVLVYAPRDTSELDTVTALVRAAWRNAVAPPYQPSTGDNE